MRSAGTLLKLYFYDPAFTDLPFDINDWIRA